MDARLASGADAKLLHNSRPVLRAGVNADEVARAGLTGDALFVVWTGFTGVQRHRGGPGDGIAPAAADHAAGRGRGSLRLYGWRWRIEQTPRMLKCGGLRLDKAQSAYSDRLVKLAALTTGAAVRIIQLVDTCDRSIHGASDAATAAASRRDRRPCARYRIASHHRKRIHPGENSRPLHPDSHSRCMHPVAPGGKRREHQHRPHASLRCSPAWRRTLPSRPALQWAHRSLPCPRSALCRTWRKPAASPGRRTRRLGRRASWRGGIAGWGDMVVPGYEETAAPY